MIVKNLKQHRDRVGITQEELARMANISYRTVSNAERGKTCSFATAKKLAKAIGVKLEDLREVTP